MEAKISTLCRQMVNSQHQNKKLKGNHMDVLYQSMTGIYFQEEVLMDILSRLPLRSLLRFKCVSKFWNTLISDPCFAIKTKLSPQEVRDCVDNLGDYLFHLQLRFYKDRMEELKEFMKKKKEDLKEFMKTYPLDQKTRESLSYPTGSSDDENTDEDDITDEDEEDDSEYETSTSEEYDSEEEVDDVESADGSDDDESGNGAADADADNGKKDKLSAEEKVDPRDNNNRLFYTLYLVMLFEEIFKDKKADLKEIQVKHPLSRHYRELLGYHSGRDVHPSEDDNTKDECAAAEEHDSKVVDAAKSVDGPNNYDGDDNTSDNGGVAA